MGKNQELPDNFHFYDYGISDKSGFINFYLPKNPDHVSGSLELPQTCNHQNYEWVETKY